MPPQILADTTLREKSQHKLYHQREVSMFKSPEDTQQIQNEYNHNKEVSKMKTFAKR